MQPISPPQLSKITTRINKAAKEAGSVLFIILMAVALFAALAYAVTQSTRSGGGDISKENAKLGASQIVQFSTIVKSEVSRLVLINGVDIEKIDFTRIVKLENGTNATDTRKFTACGTSCFPVFATQGGQIPYRDFFEYGENPRPVSIGDTSHRRGSAYFFVASLRNVGTSSSDLVMDIRGIDPRVCEEINRALDIPLPITSWTYTGGWSGFPASMDASTTIFNSNPSLDGQMSYCAYENNAYRYSTVIWAR